jgi:hypothetical protein
MYLKLKKAVDKEYGFIKSTSNGVNNDQLSMTIDQ